MNPRSITPEVKKTTAVDRWSRGLGIAALVLLILVLLAFGGFWFVLSLALSVLGGSLAGIPGLRIIFIPLFGLLHFAVWLGGVILWIIGIVKAFQGQKWEYPFISQQCKKWFPNFS